MNLAPDGLIKIKDFKKAFGEQIQPAIIVTDLLMQSNPLTMGTSELQYSPELGLSHAPEFFVPHNNIIASNANVNGSGINAASVVKNYNAYLLAGIPDTARVTWKEFQFGDGTPYLFNYPDTLGFGHQVIDIKCKEYEKQPTFRAQAQIDTSVEAGMGYRFLYTRTYGDAVASSLDWFAFIFKVGDVYYRLFQTRQEGWSLQVRTSYTADETGSHLTDEFGRKIFASDARVPVVAEEWATLYKNLTGLQQARSSGQQSRTIGSEAMEIRVFALSNRISVWVTGMSEPVATPQYMNRTSAWNSDGSYNNVFTDCVVDCLNLSHLSMSLHVSKFRCQSYYRSYPQQLGFVPLATTPPAYRVFYNDGVSDFWNSGSGTSDGAITVETVSGTEATAAPVYDLTLNLPVENAWQGVNYAGLTPYIAKVQTCVKAVAIQPDYGAGGTVIPLMAGMTIDTVPYNAHRPRKIEEEWSVDFDKLTFHHRMVLTFPAFTGIPDFKDAMNVRLAGVVAVQVHMGYASADNYGNIISSMQDSANGWFSGHPNDGFAIQPQFTGMCDTFREDRPAHGTNVFVSFDCDGRMRQLDERFVHAPPDLDLMNHYYAMHYLAQLAGFTDDFIGWLDMFDPEDPQGIGAGDTLANAYFLPTDFGNKTWTPTDRSLSIREMMWKIQELTGYFLWVDNYGVLQYRQWVPSSHPTPKRVFYPMGGAGHYANDGTPLEYESYMASTSNRDTRNRVLLVGIDQYDESWTPIVVKLEDYASIHGYDDGSKPINYAGYAKDLVITDSRFANIDFAKKSAVRLLNVLRQPQQTIILNTSWRQDRIYPLDLIQVVDDRWSSAYEGESISDAKYYVFGASHVTDYMGLTIVQHSTIQARHLLVSAFSTDDCVVV